MSETSKAVYGGHLSWAAAPTSLHIPRVSETVSDFENSPYASIEVALTTAQVLALDATPVELIPAPGAGKVIQLLGGVVILDYAGVQYANGAVLVLKYTNGSGAAASDNVAAASVTTAADRMTTIIPVLNVVPVANAAIVLTTASAFDTGTSPLRIKLMYAIHTTGL